MAEKGKKISESNDKTYVKKPEIYYSYKFQPYIRDLGGSPGKNMTQEDRNKRLQHENNVNAVRNVVKGLSKTFGTAISGASTFYGGGWALNRLLHLNKPSTLGQFFGKYALPANTADNISDGVELIFNPSIEGAVDLGSGVVLGRFKDLSKPARQVGELVGQGANINNMKNGGLIRKMQTAAGGPIKKPIERYKDGYRYIPDENGGWNRISDNNVSDVFATMEFTPNKTKTGSSITRTQQSKASNYRSAYNPDNIIKGFNILTLGGLNNLSPTQWARRVYDTGKLLTGDMTWSGYTNSWLNGNNGLVSLKFSEEHPYLSTGINLVGDGIGFGKIASNLSKTPGIYYHGSPIKGLTTLEPQNGLLWVTDSKSGATLYGGGITGKGSLYKTNNIDLGDNILTVNGKFHSPFKVPLKYLPENVLDYLPKDKYAYIDRIADAARLAGYSSVLFKNVLDFGGKGASINPFHSYMYKQTAIFNPINVTSESVSPISRISGFRQGGKMNILDFLKNGSGIHIKKKNRGSFTRWCGGNVTEECIRRGKASSNPKIRKKATFADNARHFKHLQGGTIVNGLMDIYRSIKLNQAIDASMNAMRLQVELDKLKLFYNEYKKLLGLQTDRSNIANANKAYNEAKNIDYSDINLLFLDKLLLLLNLKQQNDNSLISSIGGISGSILNSIGKKKNTSSNNSNRIFTTYSFWDNPNFKNSQVNNNFWTNPTIANAL